MAINTQQIGSYLKRRSSGYGVVLAEDVAVEYNESTGAINPDGSLADVVDDIYEQLGGAQEVIENAKDLPFKLDGDPGINDTLGAYLQSLGSGTGSNPGSGSGTGTGTVTTSNRAENQIYDDSQYYQTYAAFKAANPSSTMTQAEFEQLSATDESKKIIVTVKQKIDSISSNISTINDNIDTSVSTSVSNAVAALDASQIKYTPQVPGAQQTNVGTYLSSIQGYVESADNAKASIDGLINSLDEINNASAAVNDLRALADDIKQGMDVNAQIVVLTQDTYNNLEQKQANTLYLCYDPSQLQDTATLTVTAGNGGKVIGSGVYTNNTEVRAIAIPNEGYKFKEWTGAVIDIQKNNNPYIMTINGNTAISAVFEEENSQSLFVYYNGEGLFGKNTTITESSPFPAGGSDRVAVIQYTLYNVTDSNSYTSESKTVNVPITATNATDVQIGGMSLQVSVEGGNAITYYYSLDARAPIGIALATDHYTINEGDSFGVDNITVYQTYNAGTNTEIVDKSTMSIAYAGGSETPTSGEATLTYGSYTATFDLNIIATTPVTEPESEPETPETPDNPEEPTE